MERSDRSAPGDAGALAGRAWLAALPDELAARRRVMVGLADRCETWPLAVSLLVGCSLGRGAAHALSDIDAALGVDVPPGEAGAERVGTIDAAGLRGAARASASVLAAASEAAARRHPADLPVAMAAYVTRALDREP